MSFARLVTASWTGMRRVPIFSSSKRSAAFSTAEPRLWAAISIRVHGANTRRPSPIIRALCGPGASQERPQSVCFTGRLSHTLTLDVSRMYAQP
jgi:hypothetical protein